MSCYEQKILTVLFESLRRNYAIWHFIRYEKIADIVNGLDAECVLDIGCGIGLLDFLLSNKMVVGVDKDPKNVREANFIRKKFRPEEDVIHSFVVADLSFLPFRDSFDVVVCSEVLEHLSDDRKALKRMLSSLKQQGFALITLPNLYRLDFSRLFTLRRTKTHIYPSHIREYHVSDIKRLVASLPTRNVKITGLYFDFPCFHILAIMHARLNFPLKMRFLIYNALQHAYTALWAFLEKMFWRHTYYILIILAKK